MQSIRLIGNVIPERIELPTSKISEIAQITYKLASNKRVLVVHICKSQLQIIHTTQEIPTQI